MKQIMSNEGLLIANNSMLKCGKERCYCLVVLKAILSNPVLQNDFLSIPEFAVSKINIGKKQKKKSVETLSSNSLLISRLITTMLKIKPQLVDMPCIKFYFDKTVAVLTTPDISLLSLTGKIYYVKPTIIYAMYVYIKRMVSNQFTRMMKHCILPDTVFNCG